MIKLGKNGNVMMTVPHLTASSMTSKSHMKIFRLQNRTMMGQQRAEFVKCDRYLKGV